MMYDTGTIMYDLKWGHVYKLQSSTDKPKLHFWTPVKITSEGEGLSWQTIAYCMKVDANCTGDLLTFCILYNRSSQNCSSRERIVGECFCQRLSKEFYQCTIYLEAVLICNFINDHKSNAWKHSLSSSVSFLPI